MNRFIKESNKACDFVFVSCSGAVIQDLISQPQPSKRKSDGVTREGTAPLCQPKSQIDLVRDWRDEKGYARVNCAVLGVGGNNSGFAETIEAAMVGFGIGDAVRSHVSQGLTFLAGANAYSELDSELKSRLGIQHVVIFGYPDVVHGADGNVCPTDCSPEGSINTISPDDMAFAAELQRVLNDRVRAAGNLPGWRYADVSGATRNHGICVCSDMYCNTWTAATGLRLGILAGGVGVEELYSALKEPCSLGNQAIKVPGGASCSFHPSERGYREYVAPILQEINTLYGN